jgi:hypothetical protein
LINVFIVQDVYKNISSTVLGVVQGLNVTAFAYGSTGRYAFTAIRRLLVFIHHQICTASDICAASNMYSLKYVHS